MVSQMTIFRASACGSRFVLGEVNSESDTVTVWNSMSLSPEGSVAGITGDSSGRIAINPRKSLLFAGTWEHGIRCLNYRTGEVLWHRRDLLGVQHVDCGYAFSESVFVGLTTDDWRIDSPGTFDGVVELDAATGAEKWRTKLGDEMYVHPTLPMLLIFDGVAQKLLILDEARKTVARAKVPHFGLLGVAFSDSCAALAVGQAGLQVISLKNGRQIYAWKPNTRITNCIDIAFDEVSGTLAVRDDWSEVWMSLLDARSGRLISEYQINLSDGCFITGGTRFVDTGGHVIATRTGETVGGVRV
jgi:outer membrane protein assembly factor BamB